MAKRIRDRENIPKVSIDSRSKFWLLPGVVIQWFIYMNPARGFRGVAGSTRAARSPLMTYVYSIMFWIGLTAIMIFLLTSLRAHS
jgi:hypothetical protein